MIAPINAGTLSVATISNGGNSIDVSGTANTIIGTTNINDSVNNDTNINTGNIGSGNRPGAGQGGAGVHGGRRARAVSARRNSRTCA